MAKHLELDEARKEIEALKAEGFTTFLPGDDPERGSFGVTALRTRPDGSEEQRRVEWLPFGEIKTEVRVARDLTEFEHLLDSLRKECLSPAMGHVRAPAVFGCDDPVRREVGFVAYSEGTAHVVKCPLTVLKDPRMSPELRAEMAVMQHQRVNLLLLGP